MSKEYRIAIAEDTAEDAEAVRSLLMQYAKEYGYVFDIKVYSNGESFLTGFKSQFDFIILDVELGDRNGIDVARVIRKTDEDVIIMFQTNLGKYATSGYEVSAIDYVLKPLRYPSLSLKLGRVMRRLAAKADEAIVVKTESGYMKIDLSGLLYLEIFGHEVIFHEADRTTSAYGTLKQFEDRLRPHNFLRCNSCYLVNAAKIEGIMQYDILLSNGETIKASHPRRKEFVRDFKRFMLEKGC